MAAKETEHSRYKSKFGGGFITAAQFLAEMMCERVEGRKGKHLRWKFWDLPAWKKRYLAQVLQAQRLLKEYDASAIFRALRTREGKVVYSLSAKFLLPMIVAEQDKLDLQKAARAKMSPPPGPPPVETKWTPPPSFAEKKSIIYKLREVEKRSEAGG
jgi:hypothetical protein